MQRLSVPIACLALGLRVGGVASYTTRRQGEKARLNTPFTPIIPRTWDSLAMADTELPLATSGGPRVSGSVSTEPAGFWHR